MKIESRIGKSTCPANNIYQFITDLNNLEGLIPGERVKDWHSDKDQCQFTVSPVGKMGMRIQEKEPHSLVKITSDKDISQYNFTLWIQLKEVSQEDTRIKITVQPEVSQFLLPMIKSPLRQFVESLVDQMEKFEYPS